MILRVASKQRNVDASDGRSIRENAPSTYKKNTSENTIYYYIKTQRQNKQLTQMYHKITILKKQFILSNTYDVCIVTLAQ